MKMLTNLILPLLIYSGPLIPASVLFALRSKFRCVHFKRTLLVMAVLHILSFAPFTIAMLHHLSDALHLLLFPAATGLLSLLIGIVLLVTVLTKSTTDKSKTSEQYFRHVP
jgi:hypothetical protein